MFVCIFYCMSPISSFLTDIFCYSCTWNLSIILLLCVIQVWGTIIMQKRYHGPDYLFSFLITLGCSVFILYPVIIESLAYFVFSTALLHLSAYNYFLSKNWQWLTICYLFSIVHCFDIAFGWYCYFFLYKRTFVEDLIRNSTSVLLYFRQKPKEWQGFFNCRETFLRSYKHYFVP